jgi:hypothetical protein
MPPAGFELTIPGSELPQTHALHRAATGIGIYKFLIKNLKEEIISVAYVKTVGRY